jgi:hypothetical protein
MAGTRLSIVGAIRHDARDLALDLLEQDRHLAGISGFLVGQHTRNDLARLSINGQVELTPGPAGSAVLLAIPFTFPEQLQAGAVDQQVQGTAWGNLRPATGEAATAPAQGGVVGNREIKPKQPEHASGEALSLAQGQVEGRAAGSAPARLPGPSSVPVRLVWSAVELAIRQWPPRRARASGRLCASALLRTAASSGSGTVP